MKNRSQTFRSSCALGTAALFILFLSASAPHRVHHLFAEFQLAQTAEKLYLAPGISQGHEHGEKQLAQATSPTIHRHDDGAIHVHRSAERRGHTESSTPSGAPEHNLVIPEASHANTPRDDGHHENGAQTDCVMQSVAQNSHLTPIQAIEIVFPELEVETQPDLLTARRAHFNPSPFSQRAPPSA